MRKIRRFFACLSAVCGQFPEFFTHECFFRSAVQRSDISDPVIFPAQFNMQANPVRIFFPSVFQQQQRCCVPPLIECPITLLITGCRKTRVFVKNRIERWTWSSGKVIMISTKGNNMLDITLPLLRQPGTVRVFFPSSFQQQLCCCMSLDWMLDYTLDYSLDYGLSKITHLCEKTRRKVIKKCQKGNKEIPER